MANQESVAALCEKIFAAHNEAAELEREECDSVPGAPASDEDIARLLKAHPTIPADYVEFLGRHDGWELSAPLRERLTLDKTRPKRSLSQGAEEVRWMP